MAGIRLTKRTFVSRLFRRYHQSSAAVATTDEQKYERDQLDLTFENTRNAYKSKTSWELIRALVVLKLTTIDYLVENNQRLMKLGKQILGSSLFRQLMRHTFYGHFVAGENEKDIQPVIQRMRSFGVKSILDYSAEEDISEERAREVEMRGCLSSTFEERKQRGDSKQYQPHEDFADRRKFHSVARTYFYLDEAQCEKNMEIFLKSISAVAGSTQSTGFAAIKMTALGRPQLLMQLSELIVQTRKYLKRGVEKVKIANGAESSDRNGLMELISWSGLVDMDYVISDLFRVSNLKTGRMEPLISALTDEEEEMFANLMRRLHHIAKVAEERNVRVLIDAEQSYLQPAISRITIEMMRKFNTKKAMLFNTYQCYLKDAYTNMKFDLELSERKGFYFGVKLVRGAYMEQERLRAQQIGYEDPINESYDATTAMYHRVLTELFERISTQSDRRLAVMVASHNENSVRFTLQKMQELGIEPEHKVVCFGQLLGMCDQVSFLLGQSGFSVYKYVPYGPIEEVLPYLSRRAQENNGLLKKSDRERQLLWKEIKRRVFRGEFFHAPLGNYKPI